MLNIIKNRKFKNFLELVPKPTKVNKTSKVSAKTYKIETSAPDWFVRNSMNSRMEITPEKTKLG